MERTSNRRGFLRQLVDETARGVREVAPVMPGPVANAMRRIPEPGSPEDPIEPTVAAPASNESVEHSQLDDLAQRAGLTGRAAAVHALCRTSIRLTPATSDASGSSCLVAGGTQSEDIAPISWNDRPLQVLAQIDLTDVQSAGAGTAAFPDAGTLLLLWALHDAPSGLSTADAGSVSVVHLDRRPNRPRRGAVRIRASAELCLPRVWSAEVAELELSAPERDGWQQLRRDLALRQGVIVADETPRTPATAIHRVLGYPDERLGHMRRACQAAALGIDLEGRPPYAHPRADELEDGSERWQLLFQLSVDHTLGWNWGGSARRLYVWIDRDELSAARFSNVWAIAQ